MTFSKVIKQHLNASIKEVKKKQPHLSSFIKKGYFDLIINIPKGTGANPITDGFHIRRLSIDHHIPLITHLQNAQVFLSCLVDLNLKSLLILPWQRFATISEKRSNK